MGVRWGSIDFEKNTIAIEHKVIDGCAAGQEGLLLTDEMKTKSSRRTLPLLPMPERVLQETKARQEEYRRACRKGYCKKYLEYVCVDSLGNLLSPAFLSAHFSYLLQKNGLRHIRFHDLRHTCASLLVAERVDMKRIQLWLGHSNSSTTADIYAHLDFASKRETGVVIGSLLDGSLDRDRTTDKAKLCMPDEESEIQITRGTKT
ncbi:MULTISPECIES: site-specific integrase [Acutalibacteraceae]|uniref:site-specific integrase n=1 Tax=Acutalibacteraceae TaxID=3082771 RepID=UPI0013E8C70D|nr:MULTISPECIES: site-specific integrase [Acutalibacteraceae]